MAMTILLTFLTGVLCIGLVHMLAHVIEFFTDYDDWG